MSGARPLQSNEVEQLIQGLGGIYKLRDKALFTLSVFSGYRTSEVLSLKIVDVFQDGEVLDRITVQRRNMKGRNESRSVVTHPEAKKALREWIDELLTNQTLSPDTYLFKSRNCENKAISRMEAWRILKNTCRKVGIKGKVSFHSFRKLFADRVHEKLGRDLFKTMIALGHKYPSSTIKYLSFRQEDIDHAIRTA